MERSKEVDIKVECSFGNVAGSDSFEPFQQAIASSTREENYTLNENGEDLYYENGTNLHSESVEGFQFENRDNLNYENGQGTMGDENHFGGDAQQPNFHAGEAYDDSISEPSGLDTHAMEELKTQAAIKKLYIENMGLKEQLSHLVSDKVLLTGENDKLKKELMKLRHDFKHQNQQLNNALKSISNKKESLKKLTEQNENDQEFKRKLKEKEQEFERKLQKRIEEYERQLKDQAHEFEQKLEKNNEEHERHLKEKDDEMERKLKEKYEEIEQTLNQKDMEMKQKGKEFLELNTKLKNDFEKLFSQAQRSPAGQRSKGFQKPTDVSAANTEMRIKMSQTLCQPDQHQSKLKTDQARIVANVVSESSIKKQTTDEDMNGVQRRTSKRHSATRRCGLCLMEH